MSEGKGLEEVDESAFGKLMAGATGRSRCVWLFKCHSKCHSPSTITTVI